MNKLITIMMITLLTIPLAMAATVTRSTPQSVNPGSTFSVTYTALDTVGNFGVILDEQVSGGCSPTDIQTFFISPETTIQIQLTAPQSGTCTINGNYIVSDTVTTSGQEINFQTSNILVQAGSSTTTTQPTGTTTTTQAGATTTSPTTTVPGIPPTDPCPDHGPITDFVIDILGGPTSGVGPGLTCKSTQTFVILGMVILGGLVFLSFIKK